MGKPIMTELLTKNYRDNLEKGLCFQDYVTDKLYSVGIPIIGYSSMKYQNKVGENKGGFEIKFDDQRKIYKNLYIELREKRRKENKYWMNSGILRTDNSWMYVIGDYSILYIFAINQLRKLYKDESQRNICKRKETDTSQGFIIPEWYVEEKVIADLIIK
jgi:hypothetical protein